MFNSAFPRIMDKRIDGQPRKEMRGRIINKKGKGKEAEYYDKTATLSCLLQLNFSIRVFVRKCTDCIWSYSISSTRVSNIDYKQFIFGKLVLWPLSEDTTSNAFNSAIRHVLSKQCNSYLSFYSFRKEVTWHKYTGRIGSYVGEIVHPLRGSSRL